MILRPLWTRQGEIIKNRYNNRAGLNSGFTSGFDTDTDFDDRGGTS